MLEPFPEESAKISHKNNHFTPNKCMENFNFKYRYGLFPSKKIIFVMKLTCVLLMVSLLNISAVGFSQNIVSIQADNMSLEQLFTEIEKQTDVKFLYRYENIDGKKAKLNAENQLITVVLNEALKPNDLMYTFMENNLIVVSPEVKQQGITITGIVTDADGSPLPGASVVAKGTSQGTVSNFDGAFTLQVPNENSVLVFSFVGYTSYEITVGTQKIINVTLSEDSQQIEEVVVIGYGTARRQDITGSVGSIAAQDIVLRGTTSVIGAIQGAVPGVDITQSGSRMGNSFDIQIRGQNTMAAAEFRSPLYVVDGVVTDNIDFLNPAEIERIDILKDASSTAIYGSRGSNGVVLVKTKTADFGTKSRTTVSYDGHFGYKKIAHMPEFMDGRDFVEHRAQAYWAFTIDNSSDIPDAERWKTGRWTGNTSTQAVLARRLYDETYFDWIDACTQNGKQQNHYVNISGKSKDMSYNVGVGYQNEDGTFIHEVFDKYTLKVSVNHQPSKYFQSGATFNLSFTDANGGSSTAYQSCMTFAPIFRAYDDDGNYVIQPAGNDEIGAQYTSASNPLLNLKNQTEQTRNYNLVGNIYAQVSPIEGLDIRTTFFPRFTRTRIGYFHAGIRNEQTQTQLTEKSGSTDNRENFNLTLNNLISYTKAFGKHRLTALFINDVIRTRYERLYVTARNFPYDSEWYNLFSGELNLGNCRTAYEETSLLSYAGRVNYDYNGKYLVTATIRYDGSSKLVKKWSSFPSFGLGWRLSEEEFMKAPWLSNLKVRYSLGYTGNHAGATPFGALQKPVTTSTVYYDFNGTASSGFSPGTPVNESLSWEKTRESNFGIDFGFFKNRINGIIEYYDRLSDGLLMQRKLAIESGVGSMTDNIGSVNNRGIELSLNTVNINNKDFYWMTTLTFSSNKNAIRSLYGRKEDVPSERRWIGKPINVIYDYKILGIWTKAEYDAGLSAYYNPDGTVAYRAKPGEAKTQDIDGNGILGPDDRVILGDPNPSWIGSFSSNFQYKNWDFSFVIYSRQGVLYTDQFGPYFGWSSGRNTGKVKYDWYIPPGVNVADWDNWTFNANNQPVVGYKDSGEGRENVKYPIYNNAGGGAYYGNNGNYKDGSFVKVKNIVFGYTFNKDLIQKIGMSHLRVYVNVLNPFIFSNYLGWDPEYGSLTMENGNGPSSVVYQVGLNVKF